MRFYFCSYFSLSCLSVRTYTLSHIVIINACDSLSLCINIRMEATNYGITFPEVGNILSRFKLFLWDCSMKKYAYVQFTFYTD